MPASQAGRRRFDPGRPLQRFFSPDAALLLDSAKRDLQANRTGDSRRQASSRRSLSGMATGLSPTAQRFRARTVKGGPRKRRVQVSPRRSSSFLRTVAKTRSVDCAPTRYRKPRNGGHRLRSSLRSGVARARPAQATARRRLRPSSRGGFSGACPSLRRRRRARSGQPRRTTPCRRQVCRFSRHRDRRHSCRKARDARDP
jgi:hypothetical protein